MIRTPHTFNQQRHDPSHRSARITVIVIEAGIDTPRVEEENLGLGWPQRKPTTAARQGLARARLSSEANEAKRIRVAGGRLPNPLKNFWRRAAGNKNVERAMARVGPAETC